MDVHLRDFTRSSVLGQRHSARPIRDHINQCLKLEERIRIDFSGIEITQSFADELLGALVIQHGPDVLAKLSFAGCSESVKGIITFVVKDRIHQRVSASTRGGTRQTAQQSQLDHIRQHA
ncbi:STAS-like domain-containing protein [Bordetella bronchiseptica]|uniref:STAS-like domain-containing protein n=1 Tax=Bordetella bronchiseptica TaxID=518 RepID=UPI00067BC0A8|nr:STAS-like domain-containing protein [Bordetella bronchiseptica]